MCCEHSRTQKDHNGDDLHSIVLPLLNVSRSTANGDHNPNEPHQVQIYITSAGHKASYAYEKFIELLTNQAAGNKKIFCWGCDYRIPMMHGLLTQEYVDDLKMSSTFKESIFAREYMSIWGGGSEESWFDYEKMETHRTLKNPEWSARISRNSPDSFYIIGVDVARQRAQSVFTILRVNPRKNMFINNVVNIFTTEGEHFNDQAIALKKLIAAFNPREVVFDATGVGQGLMDVMMKPTYYKDRDGNEKFLPAYGSHNNETWELPRHMSENNIIYALMLNGPLNSEIHTNCFSQMAGGRVKFLVSEQRAKDMLLSTKVGEKMNIYDRIKRVQPHELTTILLEEIANQRLQKGSHTQIKLERIMTSMTQDKFSSFEYALFRSKHFEDEYYKKQLRDNANLKDAVVISSRSQNTNKGGEGRWGRKARTVKLQRRRR